MQYLSEQLSRFTTFKRQRSESISYPEPLESSTNPNKRFKLDYAYNFVVKAPIKTVFALTRRMMSPTITNSADEATETVASTSSDSSDSGATTSAPKSDTIQLPKSKTSSVSVQTAPQPLTVAQQRLAVRRHLIKKSTIQDVIQLEQREKYKQLLQRYTQSTNKYLSPLSPPSSDPTSYSGMERSGLKSCFTTSTPGPHSRTISITSMSPPSSDSGTGSGSESSGPIYQNKRMMKEPIRKTIVPVVKNPFDDKWLKNWQKILSENIAEKEKLINETKKHLEDVKTIGKNRHELLDKLVDKKISGEFSEDEALGEDIDSFPPLTDEMMIEVEKALSGGSLNETLVVAYNITLTRKDIITLKDLTWLNDEVINFYFNMLLERSKKIAPKIHIFNTFFYPRLLKVGHKGVARWTKKVDLFAVDIIMIPIHLGMHWCLATIDIRLKTISYYDSLLGDNPQCLNSLKEYIAAEHLLRKNSSLDMTEWKVKVVKDIPEQLNGCDCGVFTCKYADYVSQDRTFDFDQNDMPYFRRRMIWEMINNTLL